MYSQPHSICLLSEALVIHKSPAVSTYFYKEHRHPALAQTIIDHNRSTSDITQMAQRQIAVIGSLNVDFITRTSRVPNGGETLTANSFDTGNGGKGANQAVACARLADKHVKVAMVGNVGDDTFGSDYFQALQAEGIDTSKIRKLTGQKTGIANIIVEDSTGENRILLAPNANHAFSAEPSAEWDMVPEEADMVIFQLEIPLPVVSTSLRRTDIILC